MMILKRVKYEYYLSVNKNTPFKYIRLLIHWAALFKTLKG